MEETTQNQFGGMFPYSKLHWDPIKKTSKHKTINKTRKNQTKTPNNPKVLLKMSLNTCDYFYYKEIEMQIRRGDHLKTMKEESVYKIRRPQEKPVLSQLDLRPLASKTM